MYVYFNPNPVGRMVGDCSIRAIAKALDISWEDAYAKVAANGFRTAEDFCRDNPTGVYVLGFGGHVATIVDGVLYDSWDSSKEIPQYFWSK